MELPPVVAAHRLAMTLALIDEKLSCDETDAARALLASARADAAALAGLSGSGARSSQVVDRGRPRLRVVQGGRR